MPNRPESDYVTGAEFARWMREESEFRDRLERRMATNAVAVQAGLDKIEHHLAEINGRTRHNSEGLSALDVRIARIEREDEAIQQTVQSIHDEGCSQYSAHVATLERLGAAPSDWSTRKKTVIGGALVGTGTLIWPAIQEIAKAIHAILDRVS